MLCWQCSWGLFWDCHVYKRWSLPLGDALKKTLLKDRVFSLFGGNGT